jgi:hypothetical protein
MSRITLYQRLKPEIKDKLETEAEIYNTSVNCIFEDLKTKTRYSELTIDSIRTLHTFAELYTYKLTSSDVLFGEHIFND